MTEEKIEISERRMNCKLAREGTNLRGKVETSEKGRIITESVETCLGPAKNSPTGPGKSPET